MESFVSRVFSPRKRDSECYVFQYGRADWYISTTLRLPSLIEWRNILFIETIQMPKQKYPGETRCVDARYHLGEYPGPTFRSENTLVFIPHQVGSSSNGGFNILPLCFSILTVYRVFQWGCDMTQGVDGDGSSAEMEKKNANEIPGNPVKSSRFSCLTREQ